MESTHFHRLSLQGEELRDFPYIDREKESVYLDLSGNCIHEFSVFPFSGPARNISGLVLSYNNMGEIPRGIGEFIPFLETLILNGNVIRELPDSICSLVHLRYLSIRDNMFKELPKEIGNLFSLECLDLNHNLLYSLPEEIEELKNLRELRIGNNRFRDLPDSIQYLKNLEIIDASANQIDEVPCWIPLLRNLKEINLKRNLIETVPVNIGMALPLRKLNLRFNLLEKLPLSIANLSEDCELKLYDNPNSFNLYELREKWLNQRFSKEYAEYFSGTFDVLNRLNLPYYMIEHIKTFLRIRDMVFL